MTVTAYRHEADTYRDSVLLMAATRTLQESPGVRWAAAVMATPANVATIAAQGVDVPPTGANDLLLAVVADSDEDARIALDAAESALAGRGRDSDASPELGPRSVAEASAQLGGADVAIVSVPGPYAALEAHHALSAGLHVLLFSDHVSLDDEIALKDRGSELGLLVMGPGAGTAMLGGVGLGFANVVRPGPVGVVAAAGTGAQEVAALLDAAGVGVADVIGVGGRDLSSAVQGRMTKQALRILAARDDVQALLLVTKPPDGAVLRDVLQSTQAERDGKPLVLAAIGAAPTSYDGRAGLAARTLDEAVQLVLAELNSPQLDLRSGLHQAAQQAIDRLDPHRTAVRGIYSGGTLCYEAMVVLAPRVGPVRSNTPLQAAWTLPAPPGAHVCIDAGEEEFTASRPHPMIDAAARLDLLRRYGTDPSTAVVLLDVVLGHGAHADPAAVIGPVVHGLDGPVVVARVVGTGGDPQGKAAQEAALADAGCLLAPSGARAALLAAAVAARDPALVLETP
jgi:FdrA protein